MTKVSRNEHTGAALRVSGYSKEGGDSYDNIFRKPKPTAEPKVVMGYPPVTSNQSMESTGEWDETRVDTIGSNGNDGLHYNQSNQ